MKRLVILLSLFCLAMFPDKSLANESCSLAFSKLTSAERSFVNLVKALSQRNIITQESLEAFLSNPKSVAPVIAGESVANTNYRSALNKFASDVANPQDVRSALRPTLEEKKKSDSRETVNRTETKDLFRIIPQNRIDITDTIISGPEMFVEADRLWMAVPVMGGLKLYDWTDLRSPKEFYIGMGMTPSGSPDFVRYKDKLLIGAYLSEAAGYRIFDITDPSKPNPVQIPREAFGLVQGRLALLGEKLYLAAIARTSITQPTEAVLVDFTEIDKPSVHRRTIAKLNGDLGRKPAIGLSKGEIWMGFGPSGVHDFYMVNWSKPKYATVVQGHGVNQEKHEPIFIDSTEGPVFVSGDYDAEVGFASPATIKKSFETRGFVSRNAAKFNDSTIVAVAADGFSISLRDISKPEQEFGKTVVSSHVISAPPTLLAHKEHLFAVHMDNARDIVVTDFGAPDSPISERHWIGQTLHQTAKPFVHPISGRVYVPTLKGGKSIELLQIYGPAD